MSVRVLFIGGQRLVRQGLKAVLSTESDLEVIGETGEGWDALADDFIPPPDVVVAIADTATRNDASLTTLRTIKQEDSQPRVLVLSAHLHQGHFQQAMTEGAAGYELMDISSSHFANAIRAVHRGKMAINQDMIKYIAESLATNGRRSLQTTSLLETLTQRELQVLAKVAQGLSDKEIAAQLFLFEATIKSHLRIIYSKLHIHNRAQAAALAVERGLVSRK